MFLQRLKSWFMPKAGRTPEAPTDVGPVAEASSGGRQAPAFSIPVLCYHSWTMGSGTYEGDDHIALARDLKDLGRRGYRVLPLPLLVEMLQGNCPPGVKWGDRLVGLSFDDGRDYDFIDAVDEAGRAVPSMHAVLEQGREWIELCGEGPMAVSFVIASPEARSLMDKACARGLDEWRDDWWEECARRGLIGIANHSWDHVHDTLPEVRQRENRKGSFLTIDSLEDAEAQIAEAQRYIDARTGGLALPIFGYPYGHVSPYLRDEYFPAHGERIGIRAAFGTGGVSVRPDAPLWDIPRFVCGWHWRTPEELAALLDEVERGAR